MDKDSQIEEFVRLRQSILDTQQQIVPMMSTLRAKLEKEEQRAKIRSGVSMLGIPAIVVPLIWISHQKVQIRASGRMGSLSGVVVGLVYSCGVGFIASQATYPWFRQAEKNRIRAGNHLQDLEGYQKNWDAALSQCQTMFGDDWMDTGKIPGDRINHDNIHNLYRNVLSAIIANDRVNGLFEYDEEGV